MLKQSQLILFLTVFLSLCAVWFISYEFFIKPEGILDHYLTNWVSEGTNMLLHLFGFNSYYLPAPKVGNTLMFIPPIEKPIVRIGASCNGQELFVLFTLFICAYPGKWKVKIPFILIGLLIIHVANVLRTFSLVMLAYNKSHYYNFFHRYIFIFLIYGLVFLMWKYWATKYGRINK